MRVKGLSLKEKSKHIPYRNDDTLKMQGEEWNEDYIATTQIEPKKQKQGYKKRNRMLLKKSHT